MSRQVRKGLSWASAVSLFLCAIVWAVTVFVPGSTQVQAQSAAAAAQRARLVADWEASIVADRQDAEALMREGRLVDAVAVVADSWRNLPPEYPELADTAYSLVQLSNFILEYLMDDVARETARAEVLRPDSDEVGRLLWRAFEIYLGLDTAPKTEAARELDYLTGCANRLVRIVALFTLSDPYFFSHAGFVAGRCTVLVQEYPDLALTRGAIEMALSPPDDAPMETWNTGEDGSPPETALKVADGPASSTVDVSTQAILQVIRTEDPFLVRIQEAAALAQQDLGQARAHLADGIRNGWDWQERYGCAVITDRTAVRERDPELLAACQTVAERPDNMPDVFIARVIMSRAARKAPDATADTVTHWARMVSEMELDAFPFERNPYEAVLRDMRSTAKWLEEHEAPAEAAAWYQDVAERFPNSTVATTCEAKLAELMAQP